MTRVTDSNGVNTNPERESDAPDFDLNTWHNIRVEVDVYNKMVYTYQDGKLVSQGPYTAGNTSLESAHWGLYTRGVSQATLMNDDIELYTWR